MLEACEVLSDWTGKRRGTAAFLPRAGIWRHWAATAALGRTGQSRRRSRVEPVKISKPGVLCAGTGLISSLRAWVRGACERRPLPLLLRRRWLRACRAQVHSPALRHCAAPVQAPRPSCVAAWRPREPAGADRSGSWESW